MNIIKKQFSFFGTDIEIGIVEGIREEEAKKDIQEAVELYKRYQKIFNRFDKESELSGLNLNLKKFLPASKEMIEVGEKSLLYFKETESMFDPRILGVLRETGYDKSFKDRDFFESLKSKNVNIKQEFEKPLSEELIIRDAEIFFAKTMDFSGLVKGIVTDKVVELLRNKGWQNFFVDSGGDIFFRGIPEKSRSWKVKIEGVVAGPAIEIFNEAVATSGVTRRKWEINGERFHHLINPQKPEIFDFELRSVTVVSQSTERADVLAKTLFLMGKKKGLEFANSKKIKALFLDRRGNALLSDELKDLI